jgi:hypothetical protein
MDLVSLVEQNTRAGIFAFEAAQDLDRASRRPTLQTRCAQQIIAMAAYAQNRWPMPNPQTNEESEENSDARAFAWRLIRSTLNFISTSQDEQFSVLLDQIQRIWPASTDLLEGILHDLDDREAPHITAPFARAFMAMRARK